MAEVWQGIIAPPLKGRIAKPRTYGITMLIDKGLSEQETANLLEMDAGFVDLLKLSFGTTALYPGEILTRKIQLAATYGIPIYPGGTFFEIALWQDQSQAYFDKLMDLGFKWVEVSDGSLEIPVSQRANAIKRALCSGLRVITEVGKKDNVQQPDEEILIQTAYSDLEAGAVWVIIEARESGQGIGIYDGKGQVIPEKLEKLSSRLPLERVIWEAPLKSQQAKLINEFGPNVNLGNIPPAEAMALEALRLGYRSDTWKMN
ncbi:MAG TPA: phosphosulfolactate synthase [Firmicutes bacterium]|jgi:phosphosulfolactate synthase|nr:phosphosulfolactate synthase [Bacillota bacterium]